MRSPIQAIGDREWMYRAGGKIRSTACLGQFAIVPLQLPQLARVLDYLVWQQIRRQQWVSYLQSFYGFDRVLCHRLILGSMR